MRTVLFFIIFISFGSSSLANDVNYKEIYIIFEGIYLNGNADKFFETTDIDYILKLSIKSPGQKDEFETATRKQLIEAMNNGKKPNKIHSRSNSSNVSIESIGKNGFCGNSLVSYKHTVKGVKLEIYEKRKVCFKKSVSGYLATRHVINVHITEIINT